MAARLARAVSVIAVVTVMTGCTGSSRPAVSHPSIAALTAGQQLSPARARQVFTRFLAAFMRLEQSHSTALGALLMTGSEAKAQAFQPGATGPALTSLTRQRIFVPRLTGYPRWFVATGTQANGFATGFLFLLLQTARGAAWRDAVELYGFGTPHEQLPDLSGVALDAHGYATAVPATDASIAVRPADLSAGFSRYFNAAFGRPPGSAAPRGYSTFVLTAERAAEPTARRYGWRILDQLSPVHGPAYALRLADGGAAVIYLTSESFGWQAVSASADLSNPRSAISQTAVPDPFVARTLHITSVRVGLKIILTLVDEHLALDPVGQGTVADYFNGKSTDWTKR